MTISENFVIFYNVNFVCYCFFVWFNNILTCGYSPVLSHQELLDGKAKKKSFFLKFQKEFGNFLENICFKHVECECYQVLSHKELSDGKVKFFWNLKKMIVFGKYFFIKVAYGSSLVLRHQGLSDDKGKFFFNISNFFVSSFY